MGNQNKCPICDKPQSSFWYPYCSVEHARLDWDDGNLSEHAYIKLIRRVIEKCRGVTEKPDVEAN